MKNVILSKMSMIVLLSFMLLKSAGIRGLLISTGRLQATRSLFRRGRKSLASNFKMLLLSMYFDMMRLVVAKALGCICISIYKVRNNVELY